MAAYIVYQDEKQENPSYYSCGVIKEEGIELEIAFSETRKEKHLVFPMASATIDKKYHTLSAIGMAEV